MQDIQELFKKMQELKKEQKDVRRELKYALENDGEYMKLVEEAKTLREKKRQLEDSHKPAKLDELKDEINDLIEMMSDIAMSTLMEGKSVYVKDEYDSEYEPVYKVTFKKIN